MASMTPRDAAAPELLTAIKLASAAAAKPNGMQLALGSIALLLPTSDASAGTHVQRLTDISATAPSHPTVAHAVADIRTHLKASLGHFEGDRPDGQPYPGGG